jgi:Cof subfamily protein (haloacid dehalogenase superfamily)
MVFLPKLLAVDVDGTLISHDGLFSKRTQNAIQAVRQEGIEVLFVTGRPPRWMKEVKDAFGSNLALIANGALRYDMDKEVVTKTFDIKHETQLSIIRRIKERIPQVAFAIEWEDSFAREKHYIPRWDDGNDELGSLEIESLEPLPVYKILVRSLINKTLPDDLLNEVRMLVGDIANVTFCNFDDPMVEISALGVDKGFALSHYAKSKNLTSSDVVAIGDNINDFSMLEWAGNSWIMGDGHPEGKFYAKFVAPTFAEDGAAQILENLLK